MISSIFNILLLTVVSSGVAALGPAAVNLGSAANYAILAQSGISTVPPSVITGNIAVSPIAATAMTGFSLTLDSSGQFSTSTQVSEECFAADYSDPTPSTLTTAVGDMGTAGSIGGLTLTPGLYTWSSAVSVDSDITISGAATDTWIFQVTGTFTIAAGVNFDLSGGALASNIVWVTTGAVSAGAGAHLEGVILGKTSIALITGATANSRLLAQTAVTLQKATVTN
ncbi:antifreeze protein [Mycena galericulata]|nr:antifreeze protein [Mycena galericulata]